MSADKITKVDENTYLYGGHTIAFSRPPGKASSWLLTVSGPDFNDSLVCHGLRKQLAKEAAGDIRVYLRFRHGAPKLDGMRLAQKLGSLPTVKGGRLVR